MGKGSKAPKAPDYGPITDILKDLATYSKQNSVDMMAWAKKAYAENKGITDKVINNALDWMNTQSGWAKEDRARWESVFKPQEDALVKEAASYATPERLAAESAKAQADVATQFEAARATAARKLDEYNVDPSQTRAGALDLGTRIAEGAAKASAGNQAQWHAEDLARELRDKAIALGRGTKADASGSAAASGAAGTNAANTTLAQTASGAQTMGTPQSWAGLTGQTATGWGNMLSNAYNDQMKAWQAQQEQSSGWGSLIGTLGGAFLGGPAGAAIGGGIGKFLGFDEGGAIPTPMYADGGGPIPPEASPTGGAITDDVPAQIGGPSGAPAQLNAGEFVLPRDVTSWMGEKALQQLVLKSRKEMTGQNGERPAQPEAGPPGGVPPGTPPEGIGAIPMPAG